MHLCCCWLSLLLLSAIFSVLSQAQPLARFPRCTPLSFSTDYALVPVSSVRTVASLHPRPTIEQVTAFSCAEAVNDTWTSCAGRGRLLIGGHRLCHPHALSYPWEGCRYWLGGRAVLTHCKLSTHPPDIRHEWVECHYDALTLSALHLPSPHRQRVSMTAYRTSYHEGCGVMRHLKYPESSMARSKQALVFDTLLSAVEIINSTGCAGSEVEADETEWSGDGREHHIAIDCTTDSLLTIHTNADFVMTPSTRLILSATGFHDVEQLIITRSAFVRSGARWITFHVPFVGNALPVYGQRARRAVLQLDLNDGQHLISRRYDALKFAPPSWPRITHLSSPHGCAQVNATLLINCFDGAMIFVHGEALTPRLAFELAEYRAPLSSSSFENDDVVLRCVYCNSTAVECRLAVTDALIAASAYQSHWGINVLDQHVAASHNGMPYTPSDLQVSVSQQLPLLERVTGCMDHNGEGTFGCVAGRDVLTLHGHHFSTIPNLRMRLWLMPHHGSRFAYQMDAVLSNSTTFLFPLPPPDIFHFESAVQYQLAYSVQPSFPVTSPAPLDHHRYYEQEPTKRITSGDVARGRQRLAPLYVSFGESCRPEVLAVSSPSCLSADNRAVNCTWRHGNIRLFITGSCLPLAPVEVLVGAEDNLVACQLDEVQPGRTQAERVSTISCTLTCEVARELRVRDGLILRVIPIRAAPPHYDHKWDYPWEEQLLHVLRMPRALSFLPTE